MSFLDQEEQALAASGRRLRAGMQGYLKQVGAIPDIPAVASPRVSHDIAGRHHSFVRGYTHFKNWVYVIASHIARRCAAQAVNVGRIESAASKSFRKPITSSKVTGGGTWYEPEVIRKSLARVANDENLVIVNEGELYDVLECPNPHQSRNAFVYNFIVNMLIAGETYVIGGPNEATGENELWVPPVRWMVPLHQGRLFSSYVLKPDNLGSKGIPLEAENVLRVCFPDPTDPKACVSPIATQLRAVHTDEHIQASQEKSYENGIFPTMAIKMGRIGGKPDAPRKTMSPRQRKQQLATIRKTIGGVARTGDPVILDGMVDSIEQITRAPREMDWMESGRTVKDRLFHAFGLNPIATGQIEGVNRAQAVVAENHQCFPPGTLVFTGSGCCPIERIQPGDKVWTHKGRWKVVEQTGNRLHQGELVRIRARGTHAAVRVTPEHPILVSRDGNVDWIAAGAVQVGDRVAMPMSSVQVRDSIIVSDFMPVRHRVIPSNCYLDPQWLQTAVADNTVVHVAEYAGVNRSRIEQACLRFETERRNDRKRRNNYLRVEDERNGVSLDVPGCNHVLPNKIELTWQIAFMLGNWLADGTCDSRGDLVWCIASKDRLTLDRVVGAVESLGARANVSQPRATDEMFNVRVSSLTLMRLVTGLLGRAKEKHIGSQVFEWKPEFRRWFVAGYVAGDGCISTQRRIRFSSVLPSIACGIRLLCVSMGWPVILSKKHRMFRARAEAPRGLDCAREYTIYDGDIKQCGYDALCQMLEVDAPESKKSHPCSMSFDEGLAWSEVVKTDTEPYLGPVCNMSVKDDESYSLSQFVVHNCKNVVNPLLDILSVAMHGFVVPMFIESEPEQNSTVVWWEPCKAQDDEIEQKDWELGMKHGFVKANDFRPRLGLDPLEEDRASILNQPAAINGVTNMLKAVGEGTIPESTAALVLARFMAVEVEEATAMIRGAGGLVERTVRGLIELKQTADNGKVERQQLQEHRKQLALGIEKEVAEFSASFLPNDA